MTAVSTRVRIEELIAAYTKRLESMPDHTPEARSRRVELGATIKDLKKALEDR